MSDQAERYPNGSKILTLGPSWADIRSISSLLKVHRSWSFIFDIAPTSISACLPVLSSSEIVNLNQIPNCLSALAVICANEVLVCVRHHGAKRKRPGEGGGGILPTLGFHVIVGWSQSPLIFGMIAGCKESHFYSLPFEQAEANIY